MELASEALPVHSCIVRE